MNLVNQVIIALSSILGLWLLSLVVQFARRAYATTSLKGPPRSSLVFGLSRYIHTSEDSGALYEQWAKEYGPVYRVPSEFGSTRVVLSDPKAIAHFYAHETFTYVRNLPSRQGVERLVGRSVLWAEGESHKRQRKTLTPAFSNVAIRQLTPIFFDSAYKVKTAWDALIGSTESGQAKIDVQSWMNHVSLDSIGIAGFSHDFRTLHGEVPEVLTVLESLQNMKPTAITIIVFLLSSVLPILGRIPTALSKLIARLNKSLGTISAELLANSRKFDDQKFEERSALGSLLKSENLNSELHLSPEEILAQMKTLLVAGYETTSISLTWALVELCQRPEVQTRLREELSQFSSTDPTWIQLTNSLPYLDAVVHEILRLHSPVRATTRIAATDDIIPLTNPIETLSGSMVNSISIVKGTTITIPITGVNRSEAFWGPDAKEFKPERWLSEEGLAGSKDIQGHRHLITFADGQRMCLGKAFALAEFKAVLCTLIRNFSFEAIEGTKIETAKGGLLPRPKIAGEEGTRVVLLVRRVE